MVKRGWGLNQVTSGYRGYWELQVNLICLELCCFILHLFTKRFYFSFSVLIGNRKIDKLLLPKVVHIRGVANFSISCRPWWLSFPQMLKIAHMARMYWPHQHFESLSFLAHPKNAYSNLLQGVEWSNKKFGGPGLNRSFGWLHPCTW